MTTRVSPLVWFALLLLGACRPDFGAPLSLVETTRVLAVRAEPPEASPGDAVVLTPLVASPAGTQAPRLAFSLCLTPKPSTENDVVSARCLAPGGTQPVAVAAAPSVTLPVNACRLFGPDLPPRLPGEPQLQPRAPDATGGYYQPVRIDGAGLAVIALERLRCNLAAASPALAAAFQAEYSPNRNPHLTGLSASVRGQTVPLDALPAGAPITFTTGWTADSPEHYPVLDVLGQRLVERREAMSVSWFATAGAFTSDRTGRVEDDPGLDTTTQWLAPVAGTAHVWLVLRDSRGGVDFASYDVGLR